MDSKIEIKDFRSFFRRRKKSIMITFLLIFGLIGSRAILLPSIYRSEATILIEGQQIPQDYIKSTVSSYAQERLELITRQVMTQSKLMEIIKKFDLYRKLRDKITTQKLIEKMSKDISLETISSQVIDKKTGKQREATIAFTLAYNGQNRSKVLQVTEELASLYLQEELKRREQLASSATTFFEHEADELKKQIQTLEGKISTFKQNHIGELPEHTATNLQAISRLEMELDRVNSDIRAVQARRMNFKTQLSGVDPLAPVVNLEGKTVMNPKERLKTLRLELVNMQSALSDKHPDVKKLKRQIKELEDQVKQSNNSAVKVRRLNYLKGELASMRGELGPKHPDVIRLSKEVDGISKEVGKLVKANATTAVATTKPDNPAYINLRTQIISAETELQGLFSVKERLEQVLQDYQRKSENAPLVEKEYSKLTRDYNTAQQKYNEITSKLMEARVAQVMENTQRGERFTIIDPPRLAEKPYKPNRLAIALIGFVLGLGAGGGLAIVRETMDNSVKTADELTKVMGAPVLSVLSLVETDEEKRVRRIKRTFWIFACLVLVVGALILVHRFVMPLDPLWLKIQSKLMLLKLL
jgi:uncharacterized protein involved in exopolysaccharide biosynthesis